MYKRQDDGGRQRSIASLRRRQEKEKRQMLETSLEREKIIRDVQIPDTPLTVQELANRMAERSADLVKKLMTNGIMVTKNQAIDIDTATLLVEEFGHHAIRVSDADVEDVIINIDDKKDIIYASISGFGEKGPYCGQRVYDPVIQALSGLTDIQADPDTGLPKMIRTIIPDKTTSVTAAQAITAALFYRERTGK